MRFTDNFTECQKRTATAEVVKRQLIGAAIGISLFVVATCVDKLM